MGQPLLRDVADLDGVLARVRLIADRVGLQAHTFEVVIGDLADGEVATCDCVPGRAWSRLTISAGFFGMDDREQDEALLHEVLHPLLDPLMRHVLDLKPELARAHFESVERVFRRDLERVVDGLTCIIAPQLR